MEERILTSSEALRQVSSQVDHLGRGPLAKNLRAAGRATIGSLPDFDDATSDLDRRFVQRLTAVSDRVRGIGDDATDEELLAAAEQVAALRLALDVAVEQRLGAGGGGAGGGGTGPTCVTRCRQEYDRCINDECPRGTGGWICLCCTPCSLQYMGCVAKCALPGGSILGGGVIAQ